MAKNAKIKYDDIKKFNGTKNGKTSMILAIIGFVLVYIGSFISGYGNASSSQESINVIMSLLPIILLLVGAIFVGSYIGALNQYVIDTKE